jgi:integrase/recombinase XerD
MSVRLARNRRSQSPEWAFILAGIRKFGKSRELPVHPSTVTALGAYLRRGDQPRTSTRTAAVFASIAGTRLLYCNVQWTFHRLGRRAGLVPRSATCRPRIHDLRQHAGFRIMPSALVAGTQMQWIS